MNCGSPQFVSDLLRCVPSTTIEKKLIIVYPNSGESWDAEKKTWLPENSPVEKVNETQKDFSATVFEWIACGANIIGGCCRTLKCTVNVGGHKEFGVIVAS